MCSLSPASAGKVAMYVLVHISKLSRGPLSHPRLLSLSFAALQLAESWSTPGDKGVHSPISKLSPGTGRKKAAEYSTHCVARLALA